MRAMSQSRYGVVGVVEDPASSVFNGSAPRCKVFKADQARRTLSMLRGIVFVATLAGTALLSPGYGETELVARYKDVLQNCNGASQPTREKIIKTALERGRDRTLHVDSAIILKLSDREPDQYPAYVASSVGLCGVSVSDPSLAASLSSKHGFQFRQLGPTLMASQTLRLVAAKRYQDFDVRYIVIVPSRTQFDTFRQGQRISFAADSLGVRQRPDALEVTAILKSLGPASSPDPSEDLLVTRYQDVLKNCERVPQPETRMRIVATALRRGLENGIAGQKINVASAIVLGVFQPDDERYPAYIASSGGICSVAVSDETLAEAVRKEHGFNIKRQDGIATVQQVSRIVASKRYLDFEVRYVLLVPKGSTFTTPETGQRISFSTQFLGVRQGRTLELTGALTSLTVEKPGEVPAP
jgi:hypothetical protein